MKTPLTREQSEKLRGEIFWRDLRVDASRASEEDRTVPASMSSEHPVARWFGNEILTHTPEALNLERVTDGMLPMLFNHDTDTFLGAAEQFRIENNRLVGRLRFSENTRAPEVWPNVKGGFPLGISIGYRIEEWKETADSDDVTVTRWTLHEVSVVTVAADHTVGPNRSLEVITMPIENQPATAPGTAAPIATPSPTELSRQTSANVTHIETAAEQRGVQIERARLNDIEALFGLPSYQNAACTELKRTLINAGSTIEQARIALLDWVGRGVAPVQEQPFEQRERPGHVPRGTVGAPHVQGGRTELEGFRTGVTEWIAVRCKHIKDKDLLAKARNSEFSGMSLIEIAREYLRRLNVDCRGMNKVQIVSEAMQRGSSFTIGHTTSDFSNILIDAANKSMLMGYQEAPETWPIWTKAVSLNDFKTHNRLIMSSFGDLDVIKEGDEYKYGTFSDAKETLTLKTMGKLFSITRQAIINDDQNAFDKVPKDMGRAATRMIGDDVYAITSGAGPTLGQDSIALFHASSHGANLITSGAAPSVSTLNVGFKTMALQLDLASNVLNLAPKYLVCGKGLETGARVLVSATYDPAGTAGTLLPNPFQNRLEVVADARLDAIASGAPWFLFADPNQFPTVEVGFLDGVQEPYMESQPHFTQDGVAFKCRIDFIVGAMAYQGAFQNDGA